MSLLLSKSAGDILKDIRCMSLVQSIRMSSVVVKPKNEMKQLKLIQNFLVIKKGSGNKYVERLNGTEFKVFTRAAKTYLYTRVYSSHLNPFPKPPIS